jgi:hypothetical protein
MWWVAGVAYAAQADGLSCLPGREDCPAKGGRAMVPCLPLGRTQEPKELFPYQDLPDVHDRATENRRRASQQANVPFMQGGLREESYSTNAHRNRDIRAR